MKIPFKTTSKRIGLALLLAALLVQLPACGEAPPASAPESAAPADSGMVVLEEEPVPGIDVDLPEMALLVENYSNWNVIEVPQFTAEETTSGLAQLNAGMLAFAAGYEDYLDGHPEEYTCKIEARYSCNSAWASILMVRAFYPSYGSYGQTEVFVYDFWEKRAVPMEEQVEIGGEEYTAAQNALWEGAYLEQGEVQETTFRGRFDGFLLFDVAVSNADGDTWTYLYATYDLIDEVEIYDQAGLMELYTG